MRQLRFALARCLMVVLMATFVMGTLCIGTSAAAAPVEPAQMMHHEAQPGSDCPTMGAPVQKGHAACAMTVCCFSAPAEFGSVQPEARLLPASYDVSVEARLTQAEPERAKKPPKHA